MVTCIVSLYWNHGKSYFHHWNAWHYDPRKIQSSALTLILGTIGAIPEFENSEILREPNFQEMCGPLSDEIQRLVYTAWKTKEAQCLKPPSGAMSGLQRFPQEVLTGKCSTKPGGEGSEKWEWPMWKGKVYANCSRVINYTFNL